MKNISIYVEGHYKKPAVSKLRNGFRKFFGLDHKPVKIIPSGSTHDTFRDFCRACRTNPDVLNLLLVDSDEQVQPNLQQFLQNKGLWNRDADENQHHLMVQVMESWIIADVVVLRNFFGQNFNENPIPQNANIEAIDKNDVINGLSQAVRNCGNGTYNKITHGSKILGMLDKEQIRKKSFYLDRLLQMLEAELD